MTEGSLLAELDKLGVKIDVCVEICGSTNLIARVRYKGKDIVFAAPYQTDGRGQRDRKFKSELGGAYFSIVTKKGGFSGETSRRAMVIAGVSVLRALKKHGLTPKLKWPNDVLVGGKKVCGILIEGIFEGDKLVATIAGIGINVQNPITPELADIMTTVSAETGRDIPPEMIISLVVKEYMSLTEEHEKYGFETIKKEFKNNLTDVNKVKNLIDSL